MAGLIHLELLTDFFNKIPRKQTSGGPTVMSAEGRFCCGSPLKLSAKRDSPALR
jgi:hypothetical protein